MYTTAALAINNTHSRLYLSGNGCPGQPRERVDVIPPGLRGAKLTTADFEAEADRLLSDCGYTRTDDWTYDAGRDAYVAGRDAYVAALTVEESK